MGGFGSGRSAWHMKAEQQKAIDVRWMARQGYLNGWSQGSLYWNCGGEPTGNLRFIVEGDKLRLIYRWREYGDEWKHEDYRVWITYTHPHLGGRRPWFTCPAIGCGRRVAVLYLAGRYAACRHCYRLAYSSQSEPRWDRAQRAANKIAAKLEEDKKGYLVKPKRMRWATFERLCTRFRAYDDSSMEGLARLMARWSP